MNIPRSQKGTHKHKCKCGLSVRAKRLHTAGETTLGPGEQDIGRNDGNSFIRTEQDSQNQLFEPTHDRMS